MKTRFVSKTILLYLVLRQHKYVHIHWSSIFVVLCSRYHVDILQHKYQVHHRQQDMCLA